MPQERNIDKGLGLKNHEDPKKVSFATTSLRSVMAR